LVTTMWVSIQQIFNFWSAKINKRQYPELEIYKALLNNIDSSDEMTRYRIISQLGVPQRRWKSLDECLWKDVQYAISGCLDVVPTVKTQFVEYPSQDKMVDVTNLAKVIYEFKAVVVSYPYAPNTDKWNVYSSFLADMTIKNAELIARSYAPLKAETIFYALKALYCLQNKKGHRKLIKHSISERFDRWGRSTTMR